MSGTIAGMLPRSKWGELALTLGTGGSDLQAAGWVLFTEGPQASCLLPVQGESRERSGFVLGTSAPE